ncbi:DHS-like NAD/FAD-binding domain-containing protein [Suillus paluster]|uniref:DHS-like NAD/FAD-binding domain-containing protein n=1 Tax=Suillus paluster TaxID=48578 RepID=UPI001B87258F|nr:DHS-like NAD/FAD-binding domain-containing protein [Suillus paluster]KAG1731808.1 DHS-like NAD/FAD-binding domain-containing protein [Suillus paluster]
MAKPGSDKSPRILDGNDLKGLAKYMKSDKCQKVFLMVSVSTSAGIPDFRSPGTGKPTLHGLNLPFPEAVFEIEFFRRNPVPFYTLAKELYPGRFRPTPTHSFITLLQSHSLLHTCFTQNIDTLERRAGVPADKIIEAHGSFATQRCIECQTPYDAEKIKKAVLSEEIEIPKCEQKRCRGLVKPDIVFFGEGLPDEFHRSIRNLREADLLIVLGTSLTVHPFASLVDRVPNDCPRVLINLDEVGHFNKPDDVLLLGKCDEVVRELCRELGWEEELDAAWEKTKDSLEDGEQEPGAGGRRWRKSWRRLRRIWSRLLNVSDKKDEESPLAKNEGQVEEGKSSPTQSPTEGKL